MLRLERFDRSRFFFLRLLAFSILVSYVGPIPAASAKDEADPQLIKKLSENLCLKSAPEKSGESLEAAAGCTDCATAPNAGSTTSTTGNAGDLKQVAAAVQKGNIRKDLVYFRFASSFYDGTSVESIRYKLESTPKAIAALDKEFENSSSKSASSGKIEALKADKTALAARASELAAKLNDQIAKLAKQKNAWALQTDEQNIKELQEYQKKSVADDATENPGYQECGLTKAELHALYFYTDHGYSFLNAAIREGGPERAKYKAFEDELNSALSKLPAFEGLVRRGANLPADVLAQHQVGSTVTYEAFTSTSIGHGFDANHRFIIKSRTGRYIAPFAAAYSEQEVLFKAGTKFKILSREKKDGVTEFVMEEITTEK